MPLVIQVLRNGKPRKDIDWNSFQGQAYLNGALTAAVAETDPDLPWTEESTVGELSARGKLLN